jgi:DNA helicase INO80
MSTPSDYDYGMDNGGYEPPEPLRRFGDGLHEFEGYTSSVRDLPPILPPPSYPTQHKGKGKEVPKRVASGVLSDATSDGEAPKRGRPTKKRKLDGNAIDDASAMMVDGLDVTGGPEWITTPPLYIPPQKPPLTAARPLVPNGLSVPPKPPRKKPGPKKKGFGSEIELELASQAPSISSDITPALSRPPSPAPIATFYFELDEHIPPLKKAKKVDDGVMVKRLKTLEESQRKVWTNIARREVAKASVFEASTCHLLIFKFRCTSTTFWATMQK